MPRALEAKTLVLVLATSISVTETREETVETVEAMTTTKAIEIAGTGKDGRKNKGKYPENIARIACSRYSINFGINPCRYS